VSQVAFFHEVPDILTLMGAASMLLSVVLMALPCRAVSEVKQLPHPDTEDGDASVRSLASMVTWTGQTSICCDTLWKLHKKCDSTGD